MAGPTHASVDAYIAASPAHVRPILDRLRQTIRAVLPEAEEAISYQIPTFRVGGRALVYFAGWKDYVSVYPLPAGDAAFQAELAPYRAGKGTARFPLDQPIPYDFVARLVGFLKAERG